MTNTTCTFFNCSDLFHQYKLLRHISQKQFCSQHVYFRGTWPSVFHTTHHSRARDNSKTQNTNIKKKNHTTLTPCNTGATGQIGSLKVTCTKMLKRLQEYFCFLLKIHGSSHTIKGNFLSSVLTVRPTEQYCFKSRVTRPAFCFTI